MNRIVLIDGKNFLYRNHYANMMLASDDGFPTGAIYGCLNSLIAISRRLEGASFVWVWDGEGETWRHRMMMNSKQTPLPEISELEDEDDIGKEALNSMVKTSMSFLGLYKTPSKRKKPKKVGYKANRIKGEGEKKRDKFPTEPRERALIQIPILKMVLKGSGFRSFEVPGLEGDDLVAMLAKRIIELDKGSEVIIHSGDRDYYQLLPWPQIKILLRLKDGKLLWAKRKNIETEYQVSVKDWTKYRALTGDASDNIPHLWKVGPVTARKMLAAGFDPSSNDYRHIPEETAVKFARYFTHGLHSMWGAVHGNYKLCQLVDDIDSPLLSEDVKEELAEEFEPLTTLRKFRKKTSMQTPENYRKIGFLLNSYQITSISAKLDEIWAIP